MSRGGAYLEVIKHYGIDERQCNQQVSDAHLEKISRSGCKQWKSLPPYLELETIVAEDIDKSPANEKSKRYDFLLKWKDMKGFSATYKQLITALLEIKCRQDAERLCEMLKKSSSLPSSPSSATTGKYQLGLMQGLFVCFFTRELGVRFPLLHKSFDLAST